jgi:hypothetical protein
MHVEGAIMAGYTKKEIWEFLDASGITQRKGIPVSRSVLRSGGHLLDSLSSYILASLPDACQTSIIS